MTLPFFKNRQNQQRVRALYTSIVAQSRHPVFYADWHIQDNVTGRFDMLSLHMALVLRRLRADPANAGFAQALFDLFFLDMDNSLRELGAGDMAVPKKIEKMGGLFYGLLEKLNAALDAGDRQGIEQIARRNFAFGGESGAAPLAAYIFDLDIALSGAAGAGLAHGTVAFPKPE